MFVLLIALASVGQSEPKDPVLDATVAWRRCNEGKVLSWAKTNEPAETIAQAAMAACKAAELGAYSAWDAYMGQPANLPPAQRRAIFDRHFASLIAEERNRLLAVVLDTRSNIR